MDINNAKRWQRQHAARLDIRAIKAERRVVERFGTDSPQVKELRAIPIARAHEVLTRAEALLAEPKPTQVISQFVSNSNVAIDYLSIQRERDRKQRVIDYVRRHRDSDAAAVIERLEATIRTQRQRITTLEDQVAGVQSEAGTARSNLKALENIVDQGIKLFDDAGYHGTLTTMIAEAIQRAKRPTVHSNSEAVRQLTAIAAKLTKAGFDGDNADAVVDDLLAIAKRDDAAHWFRMYTREKRISEQLHRTVVRRRLDEPEHGAEHAEGLAQGATQAVS